MIGGGIGGWHNGGISGITGGNGISGGIIGAGFQGGIGGFQGALGGIQGGFGGGMSPARAPQAPMADKLRTGAERHCKS